MHYFARAKVAKMSDGKAKDWKSPGDDLRREVSQRRSDAVPGLAIDKLSADQLRESIEAYWSAGAKHCGAMRGRGKCVEWQ